MPGAGAGAGAAEKFYSEPEPEPEPTKNVTAPHPCLAGMVCGRGSGRGQLKSVTGTRIRQVSIKFRITARQAGRDTSPPANGRPAAQDSGV